jgi:hypothetical protein
MNTTWPLRTVALAAEMKPRALRQWFDTRVLTLRGCDRKSTGSGDHCGLSRQRAYQAAIVQHLNRYGLSVSRAARAAYEFSDVGNIGRAPGVLYEHGKTVLVIDADGPTVKNIFSDASFSDVGNYSACVITGNNFSIEGIHRRQEFGSERFGEWPAKYTARS